MFFLKPRQEESRSVYVKICLYISTFAIVLLAYFIGQLPMLGLLFYKMSINTDLGEDDLAEFMSNPDFGIFGISSNIGFILMILMFVFALFALVLMLKVIHGRTLKDITRPHESIKWSKAFWAFGVWIMIGAVIELAFYFMHPDNYQFNLNLSSFIPLVLISLFLLPIQTSFEEYLFRGYFMQGLGRATGSKFIALLLTSILFGVIHCMNPEIQEYGFWTMQAYYLSAGLLLGIMTIMDDGLELALGVHAGTNIFGALILSYEGSAIQTDTLFRTNEIDPLLMVGVMVFSSVIFLFLCKRKYNWESFMKIFDEVKDQRFNKMPSDILG